MRERKVECVWVFLEFDYPSLTVVVSALLHSYMCRSTHIHTYTHGHGQRDNHRRRNRHRHRETETKTEKTQERHRHENTQKLVFSLCLYKYVLCAYININT